MADYYFPRDILGEIFLRLPAKTLCVCSSLCKLWRDIITNPLFIMNYSSKSNRYRGKKRLLFLQNYPNSDRCYDSESEIEYVDWPYENIRKFVISSAQRKSFGDISEYHVHGFCKGLILLSTVQYSDDDHHGSSRTLFIINPSLRVFLPLTTFEDDDDHDGYHACIGFDSISNDYKVLAFLISYESESSPPAVISLYSLNRGSWKDITVNAQYPHTVNSFHGIPVFINGYLHWKAREKRENEAGYSDEAILRFDVTREVFDIMCLPGIIFDSEYNLSLAIVFGKFCIGHTTMNACSIWLMNEYGVKESWTKQFRVEESVRRAGATTVLGSHIDSELLFSGNGERIVAYDPKSKEWKVLRSPNRIAERQTFYMGNLEESLVLFDRRVVSNTKWVAIYIRKNSQVLDHHNLIVLPSSSQADVWPFLPSRQ